MLFPVQNPPTSSSTKKESQPRSNLLARFLNKARKEQPETHYDAPLSAGKQYNNFTICWLTGSDSAYRQKVQRINDEKYVIKNETIPDAAVCTLDLYPIFSDHGTSQRYVEHGRKCIVALKHLVSTFSAVHRYAISYTHPQLPPENYHYLRRSASDLAQVLNVTSSQLCTISSFVDASIESASLSERLEESFTSLTQPYRYRSLETASSLRPTTMLFGCPLPDDLDSASIGQRAVHRAFETILISAAKKHPRSLYQAMCDAYKQQGNDAKLVEYLFVHLRASFAHATAV